MRTQTTKSKGKKSAKSKGNSSNGKTQKTEKVPETFAGTTLQIPTTFIYVNHDLNARLIDPKTGEYRNVDEMAESIRISGLLSPVGVRELSPEERGELDTNCQYQLVYGYTRFAAIGKLGVQTIAATLGEWTSFESRLNSGAENIARNQLTPFEQGALFHELLSNETPGEKISGAKLSQRFGRSKQYVSELAKCVAVGTPEILRLWKEGDGKTSLAVVKASVGVNPASTNLREDHEKQWEKYLVLTGQVTDGEDGVDPDDKPEKEPKMADPDKIVKPTTKMLMKAIAACKLSDRDPQFVAGAKAALRYAAALAKTVPGIHNPKKSPTGYEWDTDSLSWVEEEEDDE